MCYYNTLEFSTKHAQHECDIFMNDSMFDLKRRIAETIVIIMLFIQFSFMSIYGIYTLFL